MMTVKHEFERKHMLRHILKHFQHWTRVAEESREDRSLKSLFLSRYPPEYEAEVLTTSCQHLVKYPNFLRNAMQDSSLLLNELFWSP
jgi:hypothetical protein